MAEARDMKIVVIGGGPGGLYFALLMKKRYPACTIELYERNRARRHIRFRRRVLR